MRAFNSLIAQTYENIEIIIVDDYSTDENNRRLIEQFKQSYPGKVSAFYQKQNVGIPANKNTGFRLAKGDYITYLDGDDTYYKNKIASEIETFVKNPEADVVYSNFDLRNMRDEVLYIWATNFSPAQGYIFKDIILNKFPDCHTHRCELFRRHVLHDLGFYDEQFSAYHDLDFMLRYSLKYKVAYNNYVASSYYKHNDVSISAKLFGLKLLQQQEDVYKNYSKDIKEHGLEKAFKKYLDNVQLNKLFFLEKIDLRLILKSFAKHPLKLIKFARIINFIYKKRALAKSSD